MGKKWFAILFACLLSLVFAGCGREQMKAAPKARNRLIVATCPTFKPFEFKNDQGEYEGYEIDLVRAIAGELGMAVEFKDMPFYQALDYVKEGKADIAAASIIVTEERAKKVNFTIPYNVTDMVIIVKEGFSYRAEDMQGSPAAVEKGSVYEEYAVKHGIPHVAYSLNTEVLDALRDGRQKAAVMDRPVAEDFMNEKEGQDFRIHTLPGTPVQSFALAVNKDETELLKNMNKAIESLRKKGKLEIFRRKWIPDKPGV